MARNNDNITNARANYTAGAFSIAATGTTLPTSAASTMPIAFEDGGAIDEDGLVQTIERETENKTDMNGDTVFVLDKSHSLKFKVKFLESQNITVLKMYLGEDNVNTDANGTLTSYVINSDSLENHAVVMNLILKNGDLMRVCCPELAVTSNGEQSYKVSDVSVPELEFEALPDSLGNKAYVYFATPAGTGANLLDYAIRLSGYDYPGTIDDTNGTIAVTVPTGTTLTALKAVFTASTGATVKIGTTTQVSGTTENSFANPQTYTVSAASGSRTKSYTVTVTAAS